MAVALRKPKLVIVDVQNAIDDPRWVPRNTPDAELVLSALIGAWRVHRLPVCHVRHDSIEADSPYRPGQPGIEFKEAVRPPPDKPIVMETTNSAFTGTDLADRRWRAEDVHALSLANLHGEYAT